MRLVREAALSRQAAPAFLLLADWELVKLRQAPAFVRWLYVELLASSNLKTGAGKTSWARIAAVLDFDQAPTGRQRAGAVTLRQARDALDELAALGLVARDKGRNQAQGFLFFHVTPRAGLGSRIGESGRGSGRGSTPRKASNGAASSRTGVPVPAGVRAGGSGENSYPLPPTGRKLSTTATKPPEAVAAKLRELGAGMAVNRPPKGGRK